jgi:hypothetical protein
MADETTGSEPRLRVTLAAEEECLRGNGCEMALSLAICTRKLIDGHTLEPGAELEGRVVCWGLRRMGATEAIDAQQLSGDIGHEAVCDMNLIMRLGAQSIQPPGHKE